MTLDEKATPGSLTKSTLQRSAGPVSMFSHLRSTAIFEAFETRTRAERKCVSHVISSGDDESVVCFPVREHAEVKTSEFRPLGGRRGGGQECCREFSVHSDNASAHHKTETQHNT